MRRTQLNRAIGFRVNPSAQRTAARKREGVHTLFIEDSEFKLAVEGSVRYQVPIH